MIYNLGVMDEFGMPPEAQAYKMFLDWLADGKRIWSFFEQEGLDVPPTLKRALDEAGGNSGTGATNARPRMMALRPPDHPERPDGAKDGWVWIAAPDISLQNLILAILNGAGQVPIKDVVKRVCKIRPNSSGGSVYNAASKLIGKCVLRDGRTWELTGVEEAPILYKDFVWSPRKFLSKQDIAATRRVAIIHLLTISADGLQPMQIVRQLDGAEWLKAPVTKDLIKVDLAVLKKEQKIRRRGNTNKWTLVSRGG